MTTTVLQSDFEGFYRAHFGDTVAMVYTFTADLSEAQDIAQEAFARAWQRWHTVSLYENPVAWVRRVACNLAHTRWRRLRVAAAHLRKQRVEDVPGISPNHVAVVAALRKLPPTQREAIVLHYVADLPVEVVARELDVPVGTVKSWLHRGRAAMAADLRIDVPRNITTPPASEVVKRATKTRRVRTAVAALLLVLLLFGVFAAVQMLRPQPDPTPIGPTPSPIGPVPTPAPTPNVDPTDPILRIDWSNATITFADAPPGCPTGDVKFHGTEFEGNWGPDTWPKASFLTRKVAIGDLTGDGKAEAVVGIDCTRSAGADPALGGLALIARDVDGKLKVAGWLPGTSSPAGYWISERVLHVDDRGKAPLGIVEGRIWNGSEFRRVSTTTRYPAITDLDLSPVAQKLPCGSLPARGELRLHFDDSLVAKDGDRNWSIAANLAAPIYFELGRLGRPYVFLSLACTPAGASRAEFGFVLLDRAEMGYRALDAVAPKLSDPENFPIATGNELDLSGAIYVWDGTRLTNKG